MSRIGWGAGRFNVDFETQEIYKGLRDWQRQTGDQAEYFRFAYEQSGKDPVYGEATGQGRVFFGPLLIPALHVVHTESAVEEMPEGFTYHDRIHVTCSYDMLKRVGLSKMDIQTQNYLKDRVVYDNKVFRVYNVQILGQIQQKDIIVTFDGVQLKPEDMVNDSQFAQYSDIAEARPLDYAKKPVNDRMRNRQLNQVTPYLHGPEPQ
ncbi:hypothetical protein SEA_LUCKYSOCKE_83 [Streptomyces phage LuckySocke]|jgi:hypothetical protein|nr:hypothetical protein SEA_ALONE_85 [Streptomyces phage Alone3]WPH58985.1 hypothetical protein SEA_LUCKYSOCKE_83 [Streptomyces phage LuckySocke]